MRKNMRIVLAVIGVVALLAFAGCAKKEVAAIKIGVAGAHSGDLASYGIPTVHAAQLVIDEVNAKGGVLGGRKIELVVEDDACDSGTAANVASKLVGEKVVAVIGHICSGATEAALGIYLEAKIPAISPSATNTSLTKSGKYPNFFRTISSDDAQGAVEVDFAINTLGLKKIAVLHDGQSYGRGLAEFVKSLIDASGTAEAVLFEGITVGAVDYSAIINKVSASGAEAVIYGGYHPEASKLVAQMKSKGLTVAFISDDGVKDQTFIDVAGQDAEGVYATGPTDTSASAMAVKAAEAHKAKYNEEPGAFFYNAYAAAQALVNAIEKAGSTDYDKLTAALRNEFVDTTLGSISFDDKGDGEGIGISVFQVQGGKFVTVK